MKLDAFLKRIVKTKGIGYIAVALVAGIALLVLNTGGGDTATTVTDKNAVFVQETKEALESLGQKVCGVKCTASVRLSHGYGYTYATDQSVRTSYNADGTVAEKETQLENRTVNQNGGTSLVIVKETPPTVAGVAMVCKNATAADISALKAMIAALYGIDTASIFVTN